MAFLARLSHFVTRTFAFWVLGVAVIAYFLPAGFLWIAPWIAPLLGVIMFGMGLTLTLDDFRRVFALPKSVLVGVLAQFIIMPLVAFALAWGFRLPADIAVGVILVGCCPGGTASNVITWLARGNTALSVTVTACSTLLAPLLTPALLWLLASQWVDVSASAMFWSITKIVLLPVLLGVALRRFFPAQVDRSLPVLPLVSVAGIVVVVAAIIAVNRAHLLEAGLVITLVVMLHNLLGLLLGFLAARWLRLPFPDQKAIAIEVGMQNSGLGATLALAYFAPIAAIPSAIFSVWHNISGPLLATFWAKRAGDTGR